MRNALVTLALLAGIMAAACDSGPNEQLVVGQCDIWCDGDLLGTVDQDPACVDLDQMTLQELTAGTEQACEQRVAQGYPECLAVRCACDLSLAHQECAQ